MRIYAAIFAVILALQSAWLLMAEFQRPMLSFFPTLPAQASEAASKNSAAARAALIGWPRSDLWIDYAQTANSALLAALYNGAEQPDGGDYAAAETAVKLGPTDARGWLLLAATAATSGSRQLFPQLKMSFYLTSYNEELFPLRMQLAVRSRIEIDDELRSFIEHELTRWLRTNPTTKHPVALAYHSASLTGRNLLSTLIKNVNPEFLAELHAAYP